MSKDINPDVKIIKDMLDDIECDSPEFECILINKLLYCIKKGGIMGRKLIISLLLYTLDENLIEEEAKRQNKELTVDLYKEYLIDGLVAYCVNSCEETDEKIEEGYKDAMEELFEGEEDKNPRIISSSSKSKILN